MEQYFTARKNIEAQKVLLFYRFSTTFLSFFVAFTLLFDHFAIISATSTTISTTTQTAENQTFKCKSGGSGGFSSEKNLVAVRV